MGFFSSFSPQSGPILASRSSVFHAEYGEGPNIAKPVEVVGSPIASPQL
jgi:hypothetical protein